MTTATDDVGLAIGQLVAYGERTGLLTPEDRTWAINEILSALSLTGCALPAVTSNPQEVELAAVLAVLLDDAVARGVISDSLTERDLLDTQLMGRLTPRPAQVIAEFFRRDAVSSQQATDWYYGFSQDTNYIRRDRLKKDMKWVTDTEYGRLDITINLAKPEKDPQAIAAAGRQTVDHVYPACQLCRENEGYAGRLSHPARSNHRLIPLTIGGQPWFLQYSPYVYYNEHCIVLNSEHVPMKIDGDCFRRLLAFVDQFPHYFVGSNADLPIVGGSILAHDHFQGGRYDFAMAQAPVEQDVSFPGFPDVAAGLVKWPMSVLRLASADCRRLAELAERVLMSWRGYTDEAVFIWAETNGEPHNTITPIARFRNGRFELDLVLRNNITTADHPLGVYHPHQELHHIKKENIGLIEVMGLAVLPARLKAELAAVAELLVTGGELEQTEATAKHALWSKELQQRYTFTPENVHGILQQEVGAVFARVLEHAGVFKRDEQGRQAFLRFIGQVK